MFIQEIHSLRRVSVALITVTMGLMFALPPVKVLAAATLGLSATPSVLTASTATQSTISLSINTGGAAISAFKVDLSYDDTVLEYVGQSLPTQFVSLSISSGGNGKVVVSGYTISTVSGSSVKLADIKFKPRNKIGSTAVRVNSAEVFDRATSPRQIYAQSNAASVNVTVQNSTQTISIDFYQDNVIDFKDITAFGNLFKQKSTRADLVKDSVFNAYDIVQFGNLYKAARGVR